MSEEARNKVAVCEDEFDQAHQALLPLLDSVTVQLHGIKRLLVACQKQLGDCQRRLNRRFHVDMDQLSYPASIDGVFVNESFENYLKEELVDTLETSTTRKNVKVRDVRRVYTHNENNVKLEFDVSFDDEEDVSIEIPKWRYRELHHLNPDKILIDTLLMTRIPEEMLQVVKQGIVNHLERKSDELCDYRKCNKIRLYEITKEYCRTDRSLVGLHIEILYYNLVDGRSVLHFVDFTLEFYKEDFENCCSEKSKSILSDWFPECV